MSGPPRDLLVGYAARDEDPDPALAAGVQLARRTGAVLEVLHALALPPLPQRATGHLRRTLERRAELAAQAEAHARRRLADELLQLEADVPEEARRIVDRDPAHALVERAAERDSDLILLGPHQRHRPVDFGSTARAVLAKAPCDVWVQPAVLRPIRHVLAPVDLSEHSAAALQRAIALAAAFGATVTVLHGWVPTVLPYAAGGPELGAAPPAEQLEAQRAHDREAFDSFLRHVVWEGVPHQAQFLEGTPEDLILERRDADLIVMGSHGRSGLAAAILGNVAYRVLSRSAVPVVAVRHPEREWALA